MPVWEIVGWTGSALVVISLIVPSIRKFRTLNLIGSLIATVYNVAFGIWPYAAMNAVIAVIDLYWLFRLVATKRDYRVIPVEASSRIVEDFVSVHEAELLGAFPRFAPEALTGADAYLLMSGDEIAGIFAHGRGEREGRILCDFVTERHRDLAPGRALYADAALRRAAPARLVIAKADAADPGYFRRMGFDSDGGDLVLAVHDR